MKLVGQDHRCVDLEWMRGAGLPYGGVQRLDVVDERPRATIRERDGEKYVPPR